MRDLHHRCIKTAEISEFAFLRFYHEGLEMGFLPTQAACQVGAGVSSYSFRWEAHH